MEQLIEDLWENCRNVREIDSNYSLSCTFQGCSLHPWVTALCTLSALPFCHKLLTEIIPKKKNRSQRPSYLFTQSMDWKTILCSQNALAFIPLIMWFLCAVQDVQYKTEESS